MGHQPQLQEQGQLVDFGGMSTEASEAMKATIQAHSVDSKEITTRLGDQVRRAVETLVRTLDRLDKDSQRILLEQINERELYEAVLTVMMRLVFLLSAEEREMLLSEPLYEENYAISTIHKQLQEQADQLGEEALGLRYDAWSRLLATFRVVYGGGEHLSMHLPAYGGNLFNPDRYPFLEGRKVGTNWGETLADPLLIDNRTVLHLLNALQYLQFSIAGLTGVRRLSFRTLDIEQIGHVYEGLLDYTAKRASTTILSLLGKNGEVEVTLDELEEQRSKGQQALLDFLVERTRRSATTLHKNLAQSLKSPLEHHKMMEACDNKQAIFERALPFARLLRKDTLGKFLIVTPGSLYVTTSSNRRSTGTHYTPRSLTEPLVQHALDPLVYIGPAEGLPREAWRLRGADEILDLKVCDPAMGSGAFLVQACRYLSEKLVEAWDNAEQANSQAADDHNGQDRHRTRGPALHPTGDEASAGAIESELVPLIAPNGHPLRERQGKELLPRDVGERLTTARRLVAERCLYGVDKDPMAVEMARLSLWLITLAKNKPFTFLDSNLRCGDSLLGVNLQQLKTLAMDEKDVRQVSFMEQAIALALAKRREISMHLEQTAADADEKTRKLAEAEQALHLLKLGADLLIGIALADPKRRATLRDDLLSIYEQLITDIEDARVRPLAEQDQRELQHKIATLRASTDDLLRDRTPFHWPLEFPEVFAGGDDEAGFAAMVGNPPFMGGQKITGEFGEDYREYLVEYIAHGKRGSADLCAYFFLNTAKLIKHGGMSALLATNTIAQGDTREVGLDQLVASGWTIPRAIPGRTWPGEANLEVAHVWLSQRKWSGPFVLNDLIVDGISPLLTVPGKSSGKPFVLAKNANLSFIGSYVLGLGFVLEPKEAQALIEKDPRNKDVLFPYLNGADLNSRSDQSPGRWVINFHDWPLERAETYPDCMQIVREKVKPERDKNNRKVRRERWWHYAERASGLYSAIADMERVLVRTLTGKHHVFSFINTGIVFDQTAPVFAIENYAAFSLLQSEFHCVWAMTYGPTIGVSPRYTPSDCFETFPFPTNAASLASIGERYDEHRQTIMQTRQEGLTKTYNRFHNPNEHAGDIVQLRELHREMDEAVARAYGWEDLPLERGYHETKLGLRYTLSVATRREVLDRLLRLNHQRHAEEVAAGLVDENSKPLKGKAKAAKGTHNFINDTAAFLQKNKEQPNHCSGVLK